MACPHCCNYAPPARRSPGVISTLFKVLLVYVGLVFAGGTLINTGHPVAAESGRLIHTITFVDPAIRWTQSHGWTHLAGGLQLVAGGARFS